MTEQDQKKWLKWFSRVGFLLPWIYLLRARQYLIAIIVYVVPAVIGYFINNSLLSLIIYLAIGITIWIKGRKMAFDKTKKSFEIFKNGYRKASKIIIIVFFALFGIILIWIFSAAIIPKLWWFQWRANDVARKSEIQQVATALIMYQIDYWTYPITGWSLDTMQDIFKDSLTSIPWDPNPNTNFNWLINIAWTPWQYMYIPLNKSWTINEWFVLVAKTETEWGSNRVFDKSLPIETMTDINSIKVCDNLIQSSYTKNINNGTCYYTNTWDLAYVYIYGTGGDGWYRW